ncbi:ankyrin [Microthyrium microscopicum]|uniref:Ankyrin n=1 Tax=Microthyrium microscopicum TaxID=703497 RepID=A0A6A6UTR1_9PEZI|nr:ankyrin [Microthyrium microscopicum]
MASQVLPTLPSKMGGFVSYLAKNPTRPMVQLLEPYKAFEGKLREVYAQEPDNPLLNDPHINTVPLFDGQENELKIRARDIAEGNEIEKNKYIMALPDKKRKANGSPAIVSSLQEFQQHFNIFSESSLSDMDWSNVVAAGSSVLTSLIPVPEEHSGSKRALRNYYHEIVAPASDVDLFLYGLTEDEAKEKIKKIEQTIKDSILAETTTVRTKNAITIASQHPVRHVQIVLRIYKSVSEILTGFDVDCSGIAYDGKQVYATPRAISALITQVNHVDLSRRSPSYENRLSKYSHRGFEAYWSELDRTKIDPTIFERSFPRTFGLARLLVLEMLPKDSDRVSYEAKRRAERGRPAKNTWTVRGKGGNYKDDHEDEVADWADEDDISNYHSFTIPYGPKFHARKIEKLFYTKDLLLNAEWNTKERESKLHRHPAFVGDAEFVFGDCCGFCPAPETKQDKLLAEEEAGIYISGEMKFITDNPGRQAIGSFNPLTSDDWTDMAYVSANGRMCRAVVDHDLTEVEKCLLEGIDPNRRDYTGRTLLHLAVMTSTVDIVKCLLKHGAYIVPRVSDGRTALHMAAIRGDADIIHALHEKNEENKNARESAKAAEDAKAESTEPKKETAKKTSADSEDSNMSDSDEAEILDHSDADSVADSEASAGLDTSTFLKVETVDLKKAKAKPAEESAEPSKIEPKDDILDPIIPAWDTACTPHHLAILFGNSEALEKLVKEFGSDLNVPIKLWNSYNNEPSGAILSLVLALSLPPEQAEEIVKVMIKLGAKSSQANMDGSTAFQYFVNHSVEMLELLMKYDMKHAKPALNWISFTDSNAWSPKYSTPLRTAIENRDGEATKRLLDLGADYEVNFEEWQVAVQRQFKDENLMMDKDKFCSNTEQPVMVAASQECPDIVRLLIEAGADVNTSNTAGQQVLLGASTYISGNAETLLDVVQSKIQQLQSAHELRDSEQPEHAMEDYDSLMNEFEPGTYKHWAASRYVKLQKDTWQAFLDRYKQQQEQKTGNNALQNKVKAINDLIAQLKSLEKYITDKGGKSFAELHLDLKDPNGASVNATSNYQKMVQAAQRNHAAQNRQNQASRAVFNFHAPDMTDAKRGEYVELMEAAWEGNLCKVKEMTTIPRGEKGDQPPLTITATDNEGLGAFHYAFLRKHVDVAFAMLDIAQAQYVPRDSKRSFVIAPENDGEDSECDSDGSDQSSDGLNLYERLPASMRNQFTIEDITQISTLVKSETSPIAFLRRHIWVEAFKQVMGMEDDSQKSAITLDEYAILKDDMDLFNKLREVEAKFDKIQAEMLPDKSADYKYHFSSTLFDYALRLGRLRFVADSMKRFGAGIPLKHLIKTSGIEVQEKPKYYQGLSIRGKKNQEWAKGYRQNWMTSSIDERPPLMRACHDGALDAVEWLLSDAPMRMYEEFAAQNGDDESVKLLSQAPGGLRKAVQDWLNTRRQLAIHSAMLCGDVEKRQKLISYLIKAVPESLNGKSNDGRTPLHLAFARRDTATANLLIDAGASIEAKMDNGDNILHSLLTIFRSPQSWSSHQAPLDHASIDKMLALLDPALVKNLLLMRNTYPAGARTPLQKWLALDPYTSKSRSSKKHCCASETLRLILRYSDTEDLDLVDGAGDTITHKLVASTKPRLLSIIFQVRPSVIQRENAVGRTPMEVARDAWLAEQVREPPKVGLGKYHWNVRARNQNVLQKPLDWFKHSREEPDMKTVVWEMCRAQFEKWTGKRRLVSLAEANEVAKRLTGSKSDEVILARTGDSASDEVNQWWTEPALGDCDDKA